MRALRVESRKAHIEHMWAAKPSEPDRTRTQNCRAGVAVSFKRLKVRSDLRQSEGAGPPRGMDNWPRHKATQTKVIEGLANSIARTLVVS
jgi:hypothetical protein